MSSKRILFLILCMAMSFVSCGQGTEPVYTLGDPTQTFAQSMNLPIPTTTITSFTPFGPNSNGGLRLSVIAQSISVAAPANGLVVSADPSGQTITVMHNVHVSTRVAAVNPTVQ